MHTHTHAHTRTNVKTQKGTLYATIIKELSEILVMEHFFSNIGATSDFINSETTKFFESGRVYQICILNNNIRNLFFDLI